MHLVLLLAVFLAGLVTGSALGHEYPAEIRRLVDLFGSAVFVVLAGYAVVVFFLLLWYLLLDSVRSALADRRARSAASDPPPPAR